MSDFIRFVVLIPHRDSVRLIKFYRNELFREGLIGVYSFPIVSPIAVISCPLKKEELKRLAFNLRVLSGNNGKITVGESCILQYPPMSFLGLKLDLPIPILSENIIYQFPHLLLCSGLIGYQDNDFLKREKLLLPPSFFFRSAMVANMILRPFKDSTESYSFEWKIGEPVWIPAYKS